MNPIYCLKILQHRTYTAHPLPDYAHKVPNSKNKLAAQSVLLYFLPSPTRNLSAYRFFRVTLYNILPVPIATHVYDTFAIRLNTLQTTQKRPAKKARPPCSSLSSSRTGRFSTCKVVLQHSLLRFLAFCCEAHVRLSAT